jgi:hypothetical protein
VAMLAVVVAQGLAETLDLAAANVAEAACSFLDCSLLHHQALYDCKA